MESSTPGDMKSFQLQIQSVKEGAIEDEEES